MGGQCDFSKKGQDQMRRALLMTMLIGAGLGPLEAVELDEALRERCLVVLRAGMAKHEEAFWPAMHAAEALSLAGYGAEVRVALPSLLAVEKDAQKRCGLAREMVRAGEPKWVQLLVDVLKEVDSYAHVHAAESLFKLGWRDDEMLLRGLLKEGGDRRLGVMAAAALARGADAEGLAYLRQTLEQAPEADVFFLAAWALGQVGSEEDVGPLLARMKDVPDAWLRSFFEHALARLGVGEGQEALLRNLVAEDARLRAYAAEAAGPIRLVAAWEALVEMLDDEDLDARIRAAQSLLLLSEKPKL